MVTGSCYAERNHSANVKNLDTNLEKIEIVQRIKLQIFMYYNKTEDYPGNLYLFLFQKKKREYFEKHFAWLNLLLKNRQLLFERYFPTPYSLQNIRKEISH